jgi:hypothetical protein
LTTEKVRIPVLPFAAKPQEVAVRVYGDKLEEAALGGLDPVGPGFKRDQRLVAGG